jgi:hypothetical protein
MRCACSSAIANSEKRKMPSSDAVTDADSGGKSERSSSTAGKPCDGDADDEATAACSLLTAALSLKDATRWSAAMRAKARELSSSGGHSLRARWSCGPNQKRRPS